MSRETNARGGSDAGHMRHFQRGGRPQARQRHQARPPGDARDRVPALPFGRAELRRHGAVRVREGGVPAEVHDTGARNPGPRRLLRPGRRARSGRAARHPHPAAGRLGGAARNRGRHRRQGASQIVPGRRGTVASPPGARLRGGERAAARPGPGGRQVERDRGDAGGYGGHGLPLPFSRRSGSRTQHPSGRGRLAGGRADHAVGRIRECDPRPFRSGPSFGVSPRTGIDREGGGRQGTVSQRESAPDFSTAPSPDQC